MFLVFLVFLLLCWGWLRLVLQKCKNVFLSVVPCFKASFRADWANPNLGKAIAFDCGCRKRCTEVRVGVAAERVA